MRDVKGDDYSVNTSLETGWQTLSPKLFFKLMLLLNNIGDQGGDEAKDYKKISLSFNPGYNEST
jgi:hypothetical protein